MGGYYNNSGVPTSVELENNKNIKKYKINHGHGGGLVIPKALCILMAIGAILLAVLAALTVFFLIPRCTSEDSTPQGSIQALTKVPSIEDKDERLPRSIKPTHYRIRIVPFLNNFTTSGEETITFLATEDTSDIIFNVKEIEIDKESVKVRPENNEGTVIKVKDQTYIEGEKYKISLDTALKENQTYYLDLMFTGQINNQLHGVYRSEYETFYGNQNQFMVCTQFSPNDARRAFPCFDEPSFKAKFAISIGRRNGMKSLSNMPQKQPPEKFATEDNWYWDHYNETPEMSTYLVAFVVGDLKTNNATTNGIIKVWAKRDSEGYGVYASQIAPGILQFYEQYFGIKFPLPKIDIVALPDFGFSAMENWGLITFRESDLLFDPYMSTYDNMRQIATVLAHELAHQWFGNLVTPKWWDDLWLKEGFSDYMKYLGVNQVEPNWKIRNEFIWYETNVAFASDTYSSSRALSTEIKSNRQVRSNFDSLHYTKGASIIKMMSHFLGEEIFKTGLRKFLNDHEFGNADRNNLFDALTEEAHKRGALDEKITVNEIMDTWTKQPGFPVVTAVLEKVENNGTAVIKLSQKRFMFSDEEVPESTWWVPISIMTDLDVSYDTKPKVWLKNEQETSVTVNMNSWFLLNINQTGYFIVNYSEKNWNSLSRALMTLDATTRAQLISDSMDLARANMLDYKIPLSMLETMGKHDEDIMFVPTLMAFKKLQYLSDMLAFTPAFGLFENYHNTIFKFAYEKVQFQNPYIEDYLSQRIRTAVLEWSCRNADSFCALDSLKFYREFMGMGTKIPPNFRKIIYCTAVRIGGVAEWNFAYEHYLSTRAASEKNLLLDALGCTTQQWLLSRYLEMLTRNNTSIKIQDAPRAFEAVAKNKFGNRLAFDFLRKNWNKLLESYGESFGLLAKMVKILPKYMNSEFQLSELERFREEISSNISTSHLAFDNAIQEVKSNINWMKKNYESLEKWLQSYHNYYGTKK